MLKEIKFGEDIYAIIVSSKFNKDGIEFFTPDHFSQQLAYMKRPKDYVIAPHVHNAIKREVLFTKEVLFIKSGKVRVDFYDEDKNYLESIVVSSGDVILIAFGGHGFEMMEESEIIEVKQGPYAGEMDKVRFDPVAKEVLKIRGQNE